MVRRKQSISIVVPVYNEYGNIKQFHQQLLKTMTKCRATYEIIYVDDNSSDGTFEWLESVSLFPSVKVVRKQGIKGKAYSLIQGFELSTGSILVMIDGDLQYPPAKIPDFIQELKTADIIVAERKNYHDNGLRKLFSAGFRTIFGKMLFGLNADIQSGMKVFTREVYSTVKSNPRSPWTFDLEFLNRARHAGFTIKNYPITFSARKEGNSSINVFKQTLEIGLNALYIKLKRSFYLTIEAENATMRGAGVGHNRKKYITHTTLPVKLSAIKTFSVNQILFFILTPFVLLYLLYLFPLETARSFIAVLSILYFTDALFNLFVILKSLQKKHEISISDDELVLINESALPVYTILCPLYKEAHVVPQFLEGIAKIDWPKDKLDVMFLLEEDDVDTIYAFKNMTLPYYARTVIVPDSQPKTKPKACNYGLTYAKGEYLVIFDAEDMPDPQQLKKAYIAFKKVPEDVKCLQAKLSYYNTNQNLLTRFFTAEYALWFDVTLPGLQSLNSALPLGGTSNHFETAILRKLKGWDPFNVTEDADLGVRLFQQGYRTAIIDSTTLEEATSVTKNWLRQRSRWIKGYMQTYLVHMRNIVPFIKEKGLWHNAIFQLTVGGKIMFALINPLMWVITILYFADYSNFGPVLKAIYQPPYSYLAVCSWIFGNFIFLYSYMIAVAKRKQWDVTKYIFLIPIYWLLMSIAAVVALYQLILKPHYWEKTIHGFHLGKQTGATDSAPEYVPVTQPVAAPVIQSIMQPAVEPVVEFANVPLARKKTVFRTPKVMLPRLSLPKIDFTYYLLRWLPLFVILNVDLALAKAFLDYEDAQTYILVSLIGKSVFIASLLVGNLIVKLGGRNKTDKVRLYQAIFFTFLLSWLGFVLFGLEGTYLIPTYLGQRFVSVVPFMSYYLFGILCYGIAYRLTTYNFYKNSYLYSLVTLGSVLLQTLYMYFHHDSLAEVMLAYAYVGSINLIVLVMLDMSRVFRTTMENNIFSLLKVFDRPNVSGDLVNGGMRVLIFNWRDIKHAYSGGAEVYVHELARRWVSNGNEVTLFCGNDNNRSAYEQLDGIEIYRRGGTYTVYAFAFFYYMSKFRGKYDVIIDCENGIPFFTPIYAKEQVVLLIHHVHQEIFHHFLMFPFNILAEVLEGKIMPFVYHSNNVVTVSASSQKEILKLGFTNEKNIQIIPNGVDSSLFVSYPKTDNPSFIYLGRLKNYKNIDIAIKAFAKVVAIRNKATLSVVGSGESLYRLKKLVAELGIEKAVTFFGRVSDDEKAVMLAKSWAAIQPSRMEGWGITVIEANAAGTPVIASQVNGLQDSVINGLTGLLVPAGNVSQFANAMMKIIEDDALRMNLSGEAQLWAKNFDWNKSAGIFYNLLGNNFGIGAFAPSYPETILSAAENTANNL
jgi:cellulose synthase/poly-beta-1,6-N-acetylglucosamine synthase-like glycosyltransferase/glycosyltransferase involved in cell wall biosynthesis